MSKSNESYQIELVRRVFDNSCGNFITVGPSDDIPDRNVMIYTEGSERLYWGDFRVDIPAKMALKLGEAIVAAAKEMLANE